MEFKAPVSGPQEKPTTAHITASSEMAEIYPKNFSGFHDYLNLVRGVQFDLRTVEKQGLSPGETFEIPYHLKLPTVDQFIEGLSEDGHHTKILTDIESDIAEQPERVEKIKSAINAFNSAKSIEEAKKQLNFIAQLLRTSQTSN